MQYKTITFDANRPVAKQITEPLNSAYGVAVKVYKDGQKVNVKTNELSINGQTASGQQNGFNIFELSSGSNAGMTNFDVDVQTGINVVGEVSAIASNSTTRPRQKPFSSESYLSDFISEPTLLKASDFNVLGTFTKLSTETEWTETSSYVFCNPWRVSMTDGTSYYIAQVNADTHREVGWYDSELIKQDYEYLEVQPSWKFYFGNTLVTPDATREFKATVQIDTHGVKAKFPFYVVQKDLGYFEKRGQQMKVYTNKFDLAKPITNQITVPLNSDYGVAVKVKKDGEYVEGASVTVDGKNADELADGWKVVELTSGNAPVTKTLDVEVSKDTTLYVDKQEVVSKANAVPFPVTHSIYIPLSAEIPDGTFVKTEWLKPMDVNATLSSESGTEEYDFSKYNDPFPILLNNGTQNVALTHKDDVGTWVPLTDSFVASSLQIRLKPTIPGNSTVSADIKFNLDSGDGFSSKFKLQVQEQDLGYIESK